MAYNSSMTAWMDTEAARVAAPDARRSARFPMRSGLRICPLETDRAMTAEGLNISAAGIAFVIAEAMATGTLVRVTLPNSGLSALGRVRNSRRQGPAWRTGVEFLGSLA